MSKKKFGKKFFFEKKFGKKFFFEKKFVENLGKNFFQKKISVYKRLVIIYSFYLDHRKLSAKGISRATQNLLTHRNYEETLETGSLYRAENTRIASDRHVLNTVRTNKIALSSFDDKRYILDDGISTLPYGYIESSEPPSNDSRGGNNSSTFHADSVNDETLDRDIDDDDDLDAWVAHFEDNDAPIEWDQENILDGMSQELDRTQIDWDYTQDERYDSQDSFIDPSTSQSHVHRSLFDLMSTASNEIEFQTPDPGFARLDQIHESDLDSDDIADLSAETSAESSSESSDNSFLDREAVEDVPTQPKRFRRK